MIVQISHIRIRISTFIELFAAKYHAFFSIEEIERNPILQWACGASLIFFYAFFFTLIGGNEMTVQTAGRGTAVCWPYFQECYKLFFLEALPHGYSQNIFYMLLYAAMLAIVWGMWQKRWTLVHSLLLLLLVWESLVTLLFSYTSAAPYNYYHIVLTATLLFVSHKEFFLKLSFVAMYFMSVTTKLDSTWILGTYFTTLKTGLPLLPDALTPFFTNAVIFMQMVGSWFLLSRNRILQRGVFIYFLAFHLYSGVFVLYLYPTVSLPFLLVLFGPMYRHTPIPFTRNAIAGCLLIALVIAFQLLGFAAPGDRRMTLEGNKFGMFMFEANHQCVVTVTTYRHSETITRRGDFEVPAGTACSGMYCLVKRTTRQEGELIAQEERHESGSAWNRCYPYGWWSRLHRQCDIRQDVEKISLQMDHSINGGPFYRIVDVGNICDTAYRTLGPNDWIRQPPEAPVVGWPVQNTYHY